MSRQSNYSQDCTTKTLIALTCLRNQVRFLKRQGLNWSQMNDKSIGFLIRQNPVKDTLYQQLTWLWNAVSEMPRVWDLKHLEMGIIQREDWFGDCRLQSSELQMYVSPTVLFITEGGKDRAIRRLTRQPWSQNKIPGEALSYTEFWSVLTIENIMCKYKNANSSPPPVVVLKEREHE